MFLSKASYDVLHSLVFQPDYPGYKPSVVELPDGATPDADKRYAHVALKYLKQWQAPAWRKRILEGYLLEAHAVAERVAAALDCPPEFWPDMRYSALRVLEYPPGATSAEHTDFDLFTLMCYRDQPDKFKARNQPYTTAQLNRLVAANGINPQMHLGRIAQLLGMGAATPHWVEPSEQTQHVIVYFTIPDHDRVLPSGETVRAWLNQVMAASRTEFKAYK